jgi:HK97 family phage major capsid protein
MNPREEYKKLLTELKALKDRMKAEQLSAEELAELQTKLARAEELKKQIGDMDALQSRYGSFADDFERLASRGSVTDGDRGDPGDPNAGGAGGRAGGRYQRLTLGEYVTGHSGYTRREAGAMGSVPVPGLFIPGERFALRPMERFTARFRERYGLVAGGGLDMPLVTRDRTPDIQPILPLQPTVRDALTNTTTEFNLIPFIRQDLDTTVNRAAAFDPDGTNVKPSSDIGLIDDEAPVRTIATVLPVPDQVLDDVQGLQALITTQLEAFLAETEDDDLLNGDGTPPTLLGILNMDIQVADGAYFGTNPVSGAGADREDIDRLTAAMTLVRQVGRAEPSAVIMSPTALDWMLAVTNDNGDYYAGNPFTTTDLVRFRGKPIIVSNKIADTHALVLDGRYFIVYDRMAARVDVGYVDKQFAQNWKTLRAEERLALAGIRPAAAVDVTFRLAGA